MSGFLSGFLSGFATRTARFAQFAKDFLNTGVETPGAICL